MKKTKFIAALAMAFCLAASLPMVASAGPWHNGGRGPAVQALTPEKQAELTTLMDAHMAKMRPVHEQLWQKETTLNALSANPNTQPAQLTALIDEIGALRKQIGDERAALAEQVQKNVGIDTAMGPGMGMYGGYCGGYGQGGGYGPRGGGHGGGHHGGYGPRW